MEPLQPLLLVIQSSTPVILLYHTYLIMQLNWSIKQIAEDLRQIRKELRDHTTNYAIHYSPTTVN